MRSILTILLALLLVCTSEARPAPNASTAGAGTMPIVEASLHSTVPKVPPPIVASGLPVPRWVSVKTGRVNVRRGPSMEQVVLWTYVRPGTPIEIIAEYDTWRRIRDMDGSTGWVKSAMLDSKRTVVVTGNVNALMLREPKPDSETIAYAAPGVYARLLSCVGSWCEISARGYDGFVPREQLWGVFPHEVVRE